MPVVVPKACNLCPRQCGINRNTATGYCGAGNTLRAARAALHPWEEPCISGSDPQRGSGTVFFSGCTLGCIFCQNRDISHENSGKDITSKRLAEIFLELQAKGAWNINLVTPTQYLPWILEALALAGDCLTIPILYNSGGYERVETLRLLEGKVNIYLPDLKYYDTALSAKYSGAADYFKVASTAITEMVRQTGPVQFDENGMLFRGVIIRHLVLPGCHRDSIKLLHWLGEHFDPETIRVSLMSQYTPPKNIACRELSRPVFTYEYRKVCEEAERLGLLGYTQERSSADAGFTPPFDGAGL